MNLSPPNPTHFQAVPEQMSRVLEYYERLGFVEVIRYENPGSLPAGHLAWINLNDRLRLVYAARAQMVSRNDCLLRNRDRFDYISIVDIDEVILPRKFPDLPSYLTDAFNTKGPFDSISFKSNIHLTGVRDKTLTLQNK